MLALVAVFAFGAAVASSASAETTLAAQWLAAGVAVAAELATSSEGELLLEDEGAASSVLCMGIFKGSVNAGGVDLTTEILTLAEGNPPLTGTGKGPDCEAVTGCAEGTAASPIEVTPIGLPWSTLLFLVEGTPELFLDLVTAAAGGTAVFGYLLMCLVLSVLVEDECTATDLNVEIVNTEGNAEIPAGATTTPNANCSIGGAGKGKNKADVLSAILLTSGEALTVSE